MLRFTSAVDVTATGSSYKALEFANSSSERFNQQSKDGRSARLPKNASIIVRAFPEDFAPVCERRLHGGENLLASIRLLRRSVRADAENVESHPHSPTGCMLYAGEEFSCGPRPLAGPVFRSRT